MKVVNIIVPRPWVQRLGKGCLHGGTELLDAFVGRSYKRGWPSHSY